MQIGSTCSCEWRWSFDRPISKGAKWKPSQVSPPLKTTLETQRACMCVTRVVSHALSDGLGEQQAGSPGLEPNCHLEASRTHQILTRKFNRRHIYTKLQQLISIANFLRGEVVSAVIFINTFIATWSYTSVEIISYNIAILNVLQLFCI